MTVYSHPQAALQWLRGALKLREIEMPFATKSLCIADLSDVLEAAATKNHRNSTGTTGAIVAVHDETETARQ